MCEKLQYMAHWTGDKTGRKVWTTEVNTARRCGPSKSASNLN